MQIESVAVECKVNCYIFRGEGFEAEFLVLKKSQKAKSQAGFWQEVVGKKEVGETLWRAALREMYEETGLRPQRFFNVGVESHYDELQDRICLTPIFAAQVAPEAEVHISSEHETFQWLPFYEASMRLPYPSQRESLTRVQFYIVDQEGPLPMELPKSLWEGV